MEDIADKWKNKSETEKVKIVKLIKKTVILFVLFWLVLKVLSGVRSVKAGTVEVVTQFGKVTGRLLQPGLNFIIPFVEDTLVYNTKKITYETAEEIKQKTSQADYKDYPVDTTTKDGQGVQLTYTIRFRADPTKATWLADNIGTESLIVEKVVKTDSRAWTRTIVRDFSSTDLYSGNIRDVQDRIFDTLSPKFSDNGLILDELVLREPRFDKKYEQVMEAKQVALEQVQVEEHKATQEKFRKQQRITAAEAAAKEQELQRETLSEQVLEKMYYETWDGHLPTYVCGDSSNFLMQLPSK